MRPYIYLRALRLAEHTVFCVADGQKTYKDMTFGYRELPFSSGQQVKRSFMMTMLELLGEPEAPIKFNYELGTDKVKNGEPYSPCNPLYSDQLIGGWMQAKSGANLKRRSPLSISAMHPLHPLLAITDAEPFSFDRSNNPGNHEILIRDSKGNSITLEEAKKILGENMRELGTRLWFDKDAKLKTATGLFIYDVAIDLRRLFCVSLQKLEPEINADTEKKLREAGWIGGVNAFGPCLICPKEKREAMIPALAEALLEWRITSNQARTFSPQATLAIALSDKANAIAGAIRAELKEDTSWAQAVPRLDRTAGADLFIGLPASGYITGENGSSSALNDACQWLIDRMSAFDYENQIR